MGKDGRVEEEGEIEDGRYMSGNQVEVHSHILILSSQQFLLVSASKQWPAFT